VSSRRALLLYCRSSLDSLQSAFLRRWPSSITMQRLRQAHARGCERVHEGAIEQVNAYARVRERGWVLGALVHSPLAVLCWV
jgi:hypothetical protein